MTILDASADSERVYDAQSRSAALTNGPRANGAPIFALSGDLFDVLELAALDRGQFLDELLAELGLTLVTGVTTRVTPDVTGDRLPSRPDDEVQRISGDAAVLGGMT